MAAVARDLTKRITKMRRTILRLSAAALCVGLWQPGAWAGPFVNGNFADFSGWNGAIRASATDVLTDVAPAADAHFSLVGGGFARLQNSPDFYEVDLFQAFDLDPKAQTLSFDYAWDLTASDPVTDFVQAILWLADRSAWIDLFPASVDTSASSGNGSATTDVRAYAGQAVLLEFLLQDGDLTEDDWFEIGNVTLRSPAAVPLPATLALLFTGLGLLRIRRQ